jgi:predicted nucleotidyltransferase
MSRHEFPKSTRLALKELKQLPSEIYGERLSGIYLYGSYARGDFHSRSDVDTMS